MRKVIALALALLAAATLDGRGAKLSVARHHHHRALPGRRADRHHRAHLGRADAGGARPNRHRRERQRRRRRIGVGRVAHAAPDGYTLSIGHMQTHVFNPAIHEARLRRGERFRAGLADRRHADLDRRAQDRCRPTTSKSFIAWLKSQNGKATMGTVGVGGPTDVAGAHLREGDRHAVSDRALSRRRAARRRTCSAAISISTFGQAASTLTYVRERRAQGLCGAAAQALVGGAQRADARRARLPRHRRELLARHLGAQGHAEGGRSPSSTPPFARRWPIPRSRSASRKSARKSGRSSIKRPRRWRRSRRRKSPAGRRSSRRAASRPNDTHGRARPARTDRKGQQGRARRLAARSPEGDAASGLRARAALQEKARRRRRASRRPERACRSRQISVHHQGGSPAELSVRHVRGADGRHRAHPRLERHHRQADRRRLYQRRHRHLVAVDGALDPRRRRPLRRQDSRRLRLRPVHRRARRPLRRRGFGRDRHSGRRRLHRAAGAAHPRFSARHHHGDAVLYAGDRRRVRAPGIFARRLQPAHRHFRRRAVDRNHARRDRATHGPAGARSLRPVGGHRARRRRRNAPRRATG